MLKKLLVTVMLLASVLTLTSCSLADLLNNGATKAKEIEKTIVDEINGIDTKTGHFKKDTDYNINYKTEADGIEIEISSRYSFKTDGSCSYNDLKNSTTKEYTYKVMDSVITLYAEEVEKEYFFFYDDLICSAGLIPFVGIKEGYAASQMGTSTLGYYAIILSSVGDLPSKLTGEKDSIGYYCAVRKNGTLGSTKYISADQIKSSDFNTEKQTCKVIDITIGKATHKCLFTVL